MRIAYGTALAALAILTACGPHQQAQQPAPPAEPAAQQPAMPPAHQSSMNREIHLDPAIRAAWSGIQIKVVDTKDGAEQHVNVPIGTPTPLGDTGLVMTATEFIPDFEMGPEGITSRSAEPNNPAAAVKITEEGKPDYTGWLFGGMPEIHPYPHDRYRVFLEAGIPAEAAPAN